MPRSRWFASFLVSILVFGISIGARTQLQDRSELQAKMSSLRAQIQVKEKVFLAPSAEDLAAFAGILRQPDTGMARLLPREMYDGKLLIRGGGAYYSFARLTNEYGFGSDIELAQGELSVGFAGADFGFLTSLGDVAFDSVTAEQPGVSLLAEFKTPLVEADAREQYRRAGTGFEADGFTYRSFLPASLNTTYALRSVDYGVSDLLVAFRVTRQDADGSLTLVWTILKRFPVPQLAQ
jgi:hypothetical protein